VNVQREDTSGMKFYRPAGCEACRYTGFRGRTAVHEVVKMTEVLRRKVVDGASASEIKIEAMRYGMKPIRWDGWEKVKAGHTTLEEVLRVTVEDDFAPDEYEMVKSAEQSIPKVVESAAPASAPPADK